MSRLVCAMIVGPGEADRHLERCLKSARQWADLVVVYGDAPDRATANLIGSYAHIGRIGRENLYEQGEHLVRNNLWEMCDEVLAEGDFVCCLDADEEFAESPERVREIFAALEGDPREALCVQFFHLWTEDGSMHRVDGAWRSPSGPRICRFHRGIRLHPIHETAWVCPPLPPHLCRQLSPAILHVLHWSYARERDRAPKLELYTRLLGHDLRHVQSIVEEPELEQVPCFS